MHVVWRRLKKLKQAEYIKQHQISHGLVVYTATSHARDMTETKATLQENVSLYTARHSLTLTDLILYHQLHAAKQERYFSYKTEREIRYEFLKENEDKKSVLDKINEAKERFPDCIFNVTVNGQTLRIWVELELTQKDHKKYKDKFNQINQMFQNGEYDLIWYFADSEKIKNAVDKAKVYLTTPEKFKVEKIPSVITEDNWEVLKSD